MLVHELIKALNAMPQEVPVKYVDGTTTLDEVTFVENMDDEWAFLS